MWSNSKEFCFHLLPTDMKQIELTSKLVLAIIGLTSVSAILVPTYAVPSIKSADIVDGEVKTADLANDAVTSPKIKNGEVKTEDLASGAIKLNVHTVTGEAVTIAPGSSGSAHSDCPAGEILTGGGFAAQGDVRVTFNIPIEEENIWDVTGINQGAVDGALQAFARCVGPSP